MLERMLEKSERRHLQGAIEDVQQKILRMSSIVDETMHKALTVCVTKDLRLAQQIIEDDKRIDEKQREIEDECAKIIATEQPVATYLRFLIASIKVAALLERMGDYMRIICQNIDAVSSTYLHRFMPSLQEMVQTCSRMIKGATDAFLSKDENLAQEIAEMDKAIDALHLQVYRDVVTLMEGEKGSTESSIAFISIIRALERTADMIANLCENTIYVVTGRYVDLN